MKCTLLACLVEFTLTYPERINKLIINKKPVQGDLIRWP